MGSRILSRSFHVEKWKSEHEQEPEEDAEDKEEEEENSPPPDHAMEIDEVPPIPLEVDPSVSFDSHDAAEEDGEDDEDDGEDVGDVSMVPVADMLNARYGCSQAHLFYEKDELKMITTKPIKVGEQIVCLPVLFDHAFSLLTEPS
jgi:SET domain-containing protein 6